IQHHDPRHNRAWTARADTGRRPPRALAPRVPYPAAGRTPGAGTPLGPLRLQRRQPGPTLGRVDWRSRTARLPTLPSTSGGGQRAALIVADRLLDLFVRVHHERAVLNDRFEQRPAREQDHASALRTASQRDGIAVREHARAVRRQTLGCTRGADLDVAFERIDERVVSGADRMREPRARRQLDVEIQRISGESLDRTRRLAAIEDEGARDHLDAAAAGEIDDWDLLGLDVAIPGRLHLFFRRKVDPELEAAHAPLLLLR